MIAEAWITVLQEWAAATPEIQSVHLFGSRVKGTAKSESDLDVAVTLRLLDEDDQLEGIWIGEASDWRAALQSRVDVEVDLQVANEELSPDIVWPAVRDHGKLVFSRGVHEASQPQIRS